MTDLVCPVRPGDLNKPDYLRYAIRTWWHHLDFERLWIIGHRPGFLDWDEVGFIASSQRSQRFLNVTEPQLRFHNQRANLEALLDHPRVSPDVLWMSDDFFALRDMHDTEVPYMHRGSLRHYLHDLPEGGAYREGLAFTLKILESWGYPNPDNYAVHVPVHLDLGRLREVMDRAWSEGLQGGFMRTLYPVGATDHSHVQIIDPKIKTVDGLPDLNDLWVSTTESSFNMGKVGSMLRNRYWRPSPFEV